jgi:hypothetical protein
VCPELGYQRSGSCYSGPCSKKSYSLEAGSGAAVGDDGGRWVKIPSDAIIPMEKLTAYLLVPHELTVDWPDQTGGILQSSRFGSDGGRMNGPAS